MFASSEGRASFRTTKKFYAPSMVVVFCGCLEIVAPGAHEHDDMTGRHFFPLGGGTTSGRDCCNSKRVPSLLEL